MSIILNMRFFYEYGGKLLKDFRLGKIWYDLYGWKFFLVVVWKMDKFK